MTLERATCRLAVEADLTAVSELHLAAFPGFFLTTLGPAFLRIMYKAFLLNPGGVFVVDDGGEFIQGFAVGALKSEAKDRHLALRFLPQFVIAFMPAFARHPVRVVRRVASQFFSVREGLNIADGAMVLRSIAVRPDLRGGEIAGRLLADFEERARRLGASSVVLTTDALENDRAIGFYRKHGYRVIQEFLQDGRRRMLLMSKDIR